MKTAPMPLVLRLKDLLGVLVEKREEQRMPTTLYYNPRGDDTGHRHTVTLDGDYDLSDDTWNDSLAEQCAEDWHRNKDGWEGEWPRVFALYREKTGPAFACFHVAREYEPSFSATAC